MDGPAPGAVTPVIRRFLLALLVIGLVVTSADLYLLQHFEDVNQLAPFAAIGFSVVALLLHAFERGPASVRVLQAAMLVMIAAGVVGFVLHFRGNMEFQLEIDPSLSGMELAMKVLRAKAPPALAPGAMAQLGLIGLIYTYRHPALERRR